MAPEISPTFIAAGVGAVAVTGVVSYLISKHNNAPKEDWLKLRNSSKNTIFGYIASHCSSILPVQKQLIEVTKKHPWAVMLSSYDQQQLLHTIVKSSGAKKTLDIGVYTGYSTLSIALALPDDGKVVALDVSEEYVNIAKPFWKEAGVFHKIDLRIAPAVETLDKLIANGEAGTYDYAFIDADKPNYKIYYEKCLILLRKGGLIALDNVLWGGKVVDKSNEELYTKCFREINDIIACDDRVIATMVLTGDGTTIAMKK